MKTVKQLNKQLEASQKRIEKYESRIKMYDARIEKAIERASKKLGVQVTIENYRGVIDNKEWDLKYSISNAIDYRDENRRYLGEEVRNMAQIKMQIGFAKSEENNNASLERALDSVMSDFRVVWVEKMMAWFEMHYLHMRNCLPKATERRDRAKEAKYYFETKHRWYEYKKVKNYLSEVIKNCNKVIFDDANCMEKEEYLAKAKEQLDNDWKNGIVKLADKCRKYNLDENNLKAYEKIVSPKGIEVMLKDSNPRRVINARVIWAAEFSVLVQPHTRNIVTKREY